MKKSVTTILTTAALSVAMATTAFAGVKLGGARGDWRQDERGWWWQNEDGTWPAATLEWLDGNEDGIVECYFFDENGYMMANTTTPHGYTVNEDGAWTVDGVVQARHLPTQPTTVNDVALTTDNGGYNSLGCSNAALDMLKGSREENQKYGEVSVLDQVGDLYIVYANGFGVVYPTSNNGATYKFIQVDKSRTDLDGTYLFKYYDPSIYGEEAAQKLHGVGFKDASDGPAYAYAVGNSCRARVDDSGAAIQWTDRTVTLR